MATLKALWTEVVYANVAWYDEFVGRLEADLKLDDTEKPKAIQRARTEGRQTLLSYSETKLPQNYVQLFHMTGVFRGYRQLAKHIINETDGRLAFMKAFPRSVEEGLDNALRCHEGATDIRESEDDATSVA